MQYQPTPTTSATTSPIGLEKYDRRFYHLPPLPIESYYNEIEVDNTRVPTHVRDTTQVPASVLEKYNPLWFHPPPLSIQSYYNAIDTSSQVPINKQDPLDPACFPTLLLPSNGGYGGNATNQLLPYYDPDSFSYHIGQQFIPPPWCDNELGYICDSPVLSPAINVSSSVLDHCGQPTLSAIIHIQEDGQDYSGHPLLSGIFDLPSTIANSANPTQYITHCWIPNNTGREKFIKTIYRRVRITIPSAFAWSFSDATLSSLVKSCLERTRDENGYPPSFPCKIDNIDNPQHENGSFKGYAILTFSTPEAATLAVDALNDEGSFLAQLDKDQLLEFVLSSSYKEALPRMLFIRDIPKVYSESFFLKFIQDFLPSEYTKQDYIEVLHFPTRTDGTPEGHAIIIFNSRRLATKMTDIMIDRGFLAKLLAMLTWTPQVPQPAPTPLRQTQAPQPAPTPRKKHPAPQQTQVPQIAPTARIGHSTPGQTQALKSLRGKSSSDPKALRTLAKQLHRQRQKANLISSTPKLRHNNNSNVVPSSPELQNHTFSVVYSPPKLQDSNFIDLTATPD